MSMIVNFSSARGLVQPTPGVKYINPRGSLRETPGRQNPFFFAIFSLITSLNKPLSILFFAEHRREPPKTMPGTMITSRSTSIVYKAIAESTLRRDSLL
jgi:hypothetical protein